MEDNWRGSVGTTGILRRISLLDEPWICTVNGIIAVGYDARIDMLSKLMAALTKYSYHWEAMACFRVSKGASRYVVSIMTLDPHAV